LTHQSIQDSTTKYNKIYELLKKGSLDNLNVAEEEVDNNTISNRVDEYVSDIILNRFSNDDLFITDYAPSATLLFSFSRF
jgi:hypothetical protein